MGNSVDDSMDDGMGGSTSDNATEVVEQLFEGYGSEELPLRSYATVMGIFNLIFALFLLLTRGTKGELPNGLKIGDILLLGTATHKLSYTVSQDAVTTPIRAPFTEFREKESPKRVDEKPRGDGLRRSIGELLTCQFCLGQWIASFFAYGLVLFPRVTRLLASVFTIVTVSDFLHQIYKILMKRA